MTYDYVVVGGGIVGLATAHTLLTRHPGARLLVLEKEDGWARHQTGHNSGVIHAGIYYRPGSLKATAAREGGARLIAFCDAHGIPYDRCGKVIVATDDREREPLARLLERGRANGLDARPLDAAGLRAIEPHAAGVAALHVPATAIVDYRRVAETLARLVVEAGGEAGLGRMVVAASERADGVTVETSAGPVHTRALVNCAGLQSDRVARASGAAPGARIVPFRGEYYELVPGRRHLVRSLIYPVPNPDFPFLGVHFTRMMDGGVHCGPNAVLALGREAYGKRDVSLSDALEVASAPAFWRLAARHWREGAREMWRSVSRAAFVKSLQRLVPEVTDADVVPSAAGIRAQALAPDGRLVDDFVIAGSARVVHVVNAPSPAATASLALAESIADRLPVPSTLVLAGRPA